MKIQEYLEADGNGLYCHLEADVFGILIPYTQENVIEFTDYIQEVLSLYPLNFEIACSFGGYVITDSETPVETMFDRAYAAQKLVKGSVIQHFAYYNEELKKKEETEQRISLEMRNALTTGQFQVYLQPKCDMRTGEIIGSEELVRWVHPEEGMISPAEFIPVFERNGFISEFDHYVLEQCCQMIRRWMDTGIKIVPVSVNISRVDLYNPKLFESILSMVDRYEIPHQYIEFELTETTFVMDNAQLTALSNKLREHGFKVLMDDFGSGYSSLNCLKDLELDVIKIDLKFMPVTREDRRACAILRAVVDMARDIGVEVIAEGVETKEQAELLMSYGCMNAQGYYFYRAIPMREYEAVIMGKKMKGSRA